MNRLCDRSVRAALRCRLASANAADVGSQARDAEPETGFLLQPFVNGLHALSLIQRDFDLRPERLDLTGFGCGLFRTTQCEANTHAGDPFARVLGFVDA